MPLATERKIALRYLKPRKGEGFLSVVAGFSLIGIALGVATLIVVMSVMDGFRTELMNQILGVNGHIQVNLPGRVPINQYENLQAELKKIPMVKQAVPQIQGQAMLLNQGRAAGLIVRSSDQAALQSREKFTDSLIAGSFDNFKGEDTVFMGARLAEQFNLQLNQRITLVSPTFNTTAFGQTPRYKTMVVRGIFELGMHEFDSSLVLIPLEAARPFFKIPDNTVDAIEVIIDQPENIEAALKAIQQRFPQLQANDWRQQNRSFFNAIQVERNVMFLILTLIILVAAFNIISSLVMLVKNKSANIAILRTMGASRSMITRIFFLTGLMIGGTGALLGLVLGWLFATNIEPIRQVLERLTGAHLFPGDVYFLSELPSNPDIANALMITCMALLLSLLAALYPAWRAGRLSPVEILRSGE